MGVFWLIPFPCLFFGSKWKLNTMTWLIILDSFIVFCLGSFLVTSKPYNFRFKKIKRDRDFICGARNF